MLAARALGVPNWRIMLTHLLPNLFPIVIVALTINAGSLILVVWVELFGLRRAATDADARGNMLTDARANFYRGTETYLIVWPGIMIAVTVLCFLSGG